MDAVIDKARELLKTRAAELKTETKAVDRALEALNATGTKSPTKPAQAGTKPKGKKRGRKGNRAEQAVQIITKTPGISGSGIAKIMKIKPNYLYRVLKELEKAGRISKKGREYFPVDEAN